MVELRKTSVDEGNKIFRLKLTCARERDDKESASQKARELLKLNAALRTEIESQKTVSQNATTKLAELKALEFRSTDLGSIIEAPTGQKIAQSSPDKPDTQNILSFCILLGTKEERLLEGIVQRIKTEIADLKTDSKFASSARLLMSLSPIQNWNRHQKEQICKLQRYVWPEMTKARLSRMELEVGKLVANFYGDREALQVQTGVSVFPMMTGKPERKRKHVDGADEDTPR
jgi:hypothetical protein